MANTVLNADFRLTDATERQLLRQMVAEQQARFHPVALLVNYVVDKARALGATWDATVETMDDVSRRYPSVTQHYI